MAVTDPLLARARAIAAEIVRPESAGSMSADVIKPGLADHCSEVQCALAALRAGTPAAPAALSEFLDHWWIRPRLDEGQRFNSFKLNDGRWFIGIGPHAVFLSLAETRDPVITEGIVDALNLAADRMASASNAGALDPA